MPIKVSKILESNIIIRYDTTPKLGGSLNTNNYPIQNGAFSVNISGNNYPVGSGTAGQVLSSDGFGNIIFTSSVPLRLYTENYSSPVTPVAQGTNSIALGDAATTSVNGKNSLAIGNQSLTRHYGAVVQANGRFSSTGDAQTGRYLLRTQTINAFATEMFLDGTAGNQRINLTDDSTWVFRITITAHRSDADNGHAGYTFMGVIFRQSGANTTQIQGSIQKVVLAESNPAWDVLVSADQVNGSLKVAVQGESSKTIRWVALVETVETTN